MLQENIINGAFFSVFKLINQNSRKELNHTLSLTLPADSLVKFKVEMIEFKQINQSQEMMYSQRTFIERSTMPVCRRSI